MSDVLILLITSQMDVDLSFRLRKIPARQTWLSTPSATVILHSASKDLGEISPHVLESKPLCADSR